MISFDYHFLFRRAIDAFCEEAMEKIETLKIWKGGKIESDVLVGNADYLIAERQDYLDTPFLCIVEAKRDDFEQGLAQCLVEMQACQWQNHQVGRPVDAFGIVTNGQGWVFYKLTLTSEVYETRTYISDDAAQTLGALHYIFQECEKKLGFIGKKFLSFNNSNLNGSAIAVL